MYCLGLFAVVYKQISMTSLFTDIYILTKYHYCMLFRSLGVESEEEGEEEEEEEEEENKTPYHSPIHL